MDPRPRAGDALLRPLGDGLLAAGFRGQLQLLAELRQLLGGGDGGFGGGRLSVRGHCHFSSSPAARLDLVDGLAHVCTDLSDVRLVDRLDVLTADRHHLEFGHELAPSAVRLAGGVAGLERDGVVVIAVGHVQRDMPVVGLDHGGVDGPVVQVRRPLVLDDPAGNLHPALFDGVEDELDLTGVVEFLELLVGDRRDLHVERPLGELRVAVPAGAGLLLGLGNLLAGAHRVDQPDELHVGTGLLEPDGAGVGQHPAQRPARQDERLAVVHLQQLRHVLGRALLDGALDPLEPVHRRTRRAAGSAAARRPPSNRRRRGTRTPAPGSSDRPPPCGWCGRSRRSHRTPGTRAPWWPAPRWSARTSRRRP